MSEEKFVQTNNGPIPEADFDEVQEIIDRWSTELEYDCMDNVRVALVGDKEQEERYDQAEAGGCCGSFDIVHTCKSGREYRIGCNYGH